MAIPVIRGEWARLTKTSEAMRDEYNYRGKFTKDYVGKIHMVSPDGQRAQFCEDSLICSWIELSDLERLPTERVCDWDLNEGDVWIATSTDYGFTEGNEYTVKTKSSYLGFYDDDGCFEFIGEDDDTDMDWPRFVKVRSAEPKPVTAGEAYRLWALGNILQHRWTRPQAPKPEFEASFVF